MTVSIRYPLLLFVFIISVTVLVAIEYIGSQQEELWYSNIENIKRIDNLIEGGSIESITSVETGKDTLTKKYYTVLDEGSIVNREEDLPSISAGIDPSHTENYYEDNINSLYAYVAQDLITNEGRLKNRVYYHADNIISISRYDDNSQLDNLDHYRKGCLFARDFYVNGIYERTCFFDCSEVRQELVDISNENDIDSDLLDTYVDPSCDQEGYCIVVPIISGGMPYVIV